MKIKVERISRNTDTVRSDIKEESEGKTRTKTYANTQCKHITPFYSGLNSVHVSTQYVPY
jgi:hypothetical protein